MYRHGYQNFEEMITSRTSDIEQYIAIENQWSILNTDKNGVYIDTSLVDAYVADTIIQYARMGKVIFS